MNLEKFRKQSEKTAAKIINYLTPNVIDKVPVPFTF